MRSMISNVCCTLAVAGVALIPFWIGPGGDADDRPAMPDPFWHDQIGRIRPDIILLGNSILNEGVDEQAFGAALSVNVMKVWTAGGSSAWQYIVFKNAIVAGEHKPDVVVTFFRDHFLTEPAFRADGPYRAEIDRFRGQHEPLLDRLAYGGTGWQFMDDFLERKEASKAFVENQVKRWVGARFGVGLENVERGIENVFREDRQISELVNERQLQAEDMRATGQFHFPTALDRSFLPEMIRLSRVHAIRMIYVRMKRRPDRDGLAFRSAELDAYIHDLRDYLEGQGAALLDFGHEPSLLLQHYGAGDHLNRRGRERFLPLLVESITPLLEGTPF